MIGFELQRKNMVEAQVRPSDITDRRIIRAMLAVAREQFAPADRQAVAYMDQDLPVSSGRGQANRSLLAPRLHAKMIQALQLEDGDRALEIGCATGYGAAILGRIAKSVVALEADPQLAREAKAALSNAQAGNVTVVSGPHAAGSPEQGPYSGILISGAVDHIPAAVLDQLQDGGRLAVVMTVGGISRLMVMRRLGSNYDSRAVMEASAPALPGFEAARGFVF